MVFDDADIRQMSRAIELAKCGVGLTSPNPPVGCVIVNGDAVIGEGYHCQAGFPHAECEAIEDAHRRGNGDLLLGATIYVTLEPCSHHGRTPPCTDLIIRYGLKRVVFGIKDPNPVNSGRIYQVLDGLGVDILEGVLEDECRRLILPFMTAMTLNRPRIFAKIATTLDGRTTRQPGKPAWFTGEEARNHVHGLRSLADAILIGGETLRKDNPALTIRTPDRPVSEQKKQPWRVILTNDRSSLPAGSACLSDEHKDRTVIFEKVGDFNAMLSALVSDYGVHSLMLECGGKLLRQFLELGLVDEWVGFYAPMVTGGPGLSVEGDDFLQHEIKLTNVEYRRFGDDFCIKGDVE